MCEGSREVLFFYFLLFGSSSFGYFDQTLATFLLCLSVSESFGFLWPPFTNVKSFLEVIPAVVHKNVGSLIYSLENSFENY